MPYIQIYKDWGRKKMNTNSTTLAMSIADTLDEKDCGGKNGKIEASIWNKFVYDKGGKQIKRYITVNSAIKSLIVYINRQAREKGILIKNLGQNWIDTLKESEINSNKNSNKTDKKVDNSYSKMNREKALKKAKKDSRLEELSGGKGWSISLDSFVTDIPYAKKFTGKILSIVSEIIGEHITVTSALGTAGNKGIKTPHKITGNYCTHHNAENPKLDIRTNGHAAKLRKKLISTGLFSRVSIEPDHLDIQIKAEVYKVIEQGYKIENILAYARKNMLGRLLA